MAVLNSRHRRHGLGLLLAATVLLAELARLDGAVPPVSDAPLAAVPLADEGSPAGSPASLDAGSPAAHDVGIASGPGIVEMLDANMFSKLELGPSLAAAPVPEAAYEAIEYQGDNGQAPAPGYGPLDVAQVYGINAALADGVHNLNHFSAGLRDLASMNGSNVADVNATAGQIQGVLGSIAYVVQAFVPLIGTDTQTSEFPSYQDFMQALTILANSMVLPPSGLFSPEYATFNNVYNVYTNTTFNKLMTFLQAPTSSSNWDDVGSYCQQWNPADFLNFQTWTTNPTGTCPPTTFTIKTIPKLDSSVCLFNSESNTSFGPAIALRYGAYLNQYIAGFIAIAAVTAEMAVACKVTQIPTAYLPPLTEEYQATYNVAVNNLIGYATTMTTLFWDSEAGLDSLIRLSIFQTASNQQANPTSHPTENYASDLWLTLAEAWPFMLWGVVVWWGNTNQQFTQVGGCNPGPQNVGPQYPQLAPNVGPSCTTLGGSVYNDFTTWDSPIPSNLVYAIYFAPYNEAPQVGAQGDTLNTTVLNCYNQNSDPTVLGPCISGTANLNARGVTVVHYSNGLAASLDTQHFYFANVPFDSPDTTVVMLPSAP